MTTFNAAWWKAEMGTMVERVKKDANEVARLHEISNACGKWAKIIQLQLEAMKASSVKPDAKNMPDLMG